MAKYSTNDADTLGGVLKNKFGITDEKQLNKVEADFSMMRSAELIQKPVRQTFDLEHLKAIHQRLFQDVYEFAGNVRSVDITKGETRFASAEHIGAFAKQTFSQLARENNLKGLKPDAFAERAAHYLGEINAMHPFREGNGRSGREFMKDLARNAGYSLDLQKVDRPRLMEAMIESFHAPKPEKLAQILRENLNPLDRGRELTNANEQRSQAAETVKETLAGATSPRAEMMRRQQAAALTQKKERGPER